MTFRRPVRERATTRVRTSMTQMFALLVALVVVLTVAPPVAAAPAVAPAAAPADGVLRVLLFYKDNFHASHVQARQAVNQLTTELALQYGQTVDVRETQDPANFNTPYLNTVDAVVFAQTGGVLFNVDQRAALESFIRGGGGYMGMHYAGWSVGQSEHDVNPFYARLVGAMSEGHPENPAIRPGRVTLKATGHPLTQGLPNEITRSDEWYDWTVNPAPHVRTLLEADETSYGMGRQGTTHPITWCQQIDSGRSWYSGMGHTESSYSEPFIRQQMRHGLAYAAGLLAADCSPPRKDDQGSWSGVTPWPLMPINMALTADGKVQSFGSKGGSDPNPYDWTGDNTIYQGGQVEIDIWDPTTPRTLGNLRSGIVQNATYTDLFCSMQVQNPHNHSTMTVGGDDGLGENAPNDGSMGVTSYRTNNGLQNEAPMNIARWYPTGTTMPDGAIVVQGGSLRGGPGGPGVLTPEVYTPDEGASWKLLKGARSDAAYGEGSAGENRWWYPRAFVAPGSGNLFNISGTQMFELDPEGNGGTGAVTLRGPVPPVVANQGGLGNPVGATSTATMYRPGKILQVGGGWWANGGGPDGARAGFTVDLTTPGGTAAPVIAATQPMKYQRHWATSTVMPDGNVIVTGGSRENAGNGGYVTNAEIWNPDTGTWTTVELPYEHARLYHSTALLLPDGRIMIGGGGAPGPRNYVDVEYYSPSYLFDGNQPAVRPEITSAPNKIGYNGTFNVAANAPVSRVTLVRNGSVTHGFNNDQNFQDLNFTQGAGGLTVTAPQDGTYAPPGAYMLFVFDANGTPSIAKMLDINPSVQMDSRTPRVVEQFEYPRFPGDGAQVVDVAPGSGRMTPWNIDGQVQLVRAQAPSMGALGATGYHVALGAAGDMSRVVQGLDAGRDYRISLRYARDSRSAAGAGAANAQLSIGSLDTTLTSTVSSAGDGQDQVFETYVGTFTAAARSQTLRLAAGAGDAGMMVDNLVITSVDPGASDVPIHYEFDEGAGSTSANTGTDRSVGPATLTGTTGWSEDGIYDGSVNLPGGSNANAVDLPDNLLQGEANFTTSFWARPDTKGNWIGMFHIGDGFGGDGSFFQIQMQTQDGGDTGLAATFKKKGSGLQERIYAAPKRDVTPGAWNHVVFTRQGATGTLYLNGQQIAQRNNLTITMSDVGPTTNNWLGRNGFPDPAYDGLMDDVRLYRSALTAQDVAAMYADGTALDTTTTVSVSPASPSPFAQPITVSATVADEAAAGPEGAPDGQAELFIDGARVGAPVTVTDGAVTFPEITLSPGVHQIEVRFTGAEGWRNSAGTTQHTVQRPPPSAGVPVHYKFDEGTGTTAANSGTDSSVGPATLIGGAGWAAGQCAGAVSLPGGDAGQVNLPNNITAGMDTEITLAAWIRPTALPNWTPHVQIGKSTEEFFLLQSSTEGGARGFGATLRVNNGEQYRIQLPGETDLQLNKWTHVVVTLGPSPTGSGTTGKIYFDGQLMAGGTRDNIPVDIGDVGEGGTAANFIGNTSWPDPGPTELVDEFRIYGYELSAQQVAELSTQCPAVNRAPVGAADAYSTAEGQVLTVPAVSGVLANDTDADGNTLTATGVTQPANGTVTMAADGGFTYTPATGFAGTDTFTYRANDGTTTSAATTVTITVERAVPGNRAPTAGADAYDAVGGQVLTVPAPGVLMNDDDPDGEAVTAADATQPTHGAVVLARDGSFTYTPNAGFTGADSFTYRASDGKAASAPATVTITVKPAGGETATTAVSGAALPITHGQSGSVSAVVSPDSATGTVELRKGGTLVAAADVVDGKATLFLGAKSLSVGEHVLDLRYGGDALHKASSATVTVTVLARPVKKSTSRTVAKAVPRRLDLREDFKVATRVTSLLADSPTPTGTVRIRIDGKLLEVGRLTGGRHVLKVTRNLRPGRHLLLVTYSGDSRTWWSRYRQWFYVKR
ncbi:LamG-like jellyroll fold domain-containing protein [Nocardioides sp.]|uniref:LamG-like jellyroll fold domain-containing protein n=1 Tax=Nocardioides sp. TaxID=35761 RepID=UPI002CC1EB79|nr:LamG-like jellyroll fold domain-containing protein [Nocardioides sp.]HXH79950.1 LamG-like jellyroll fold domain-containing protein [Nocardioides sp.]